MGLAGKVNLHHTVIAMDFNARKKRLGYGKGIPSGKALGELLDSTNFSCFRVTKYPPHTSIVAREKTDPMSS